MKPNQRHHRGLTLVEAMLLLVIMSIIAVAAGVGLQAVAKVPGKTDDVMAVNNMMVSVMEQSRANLVKTWPTGTTPFSVTAASYAFTVNSNSYTPTGLTVGQTSGTLNSSGVPQNNGGNSAGTGFATVTSGATVIKINNLQYQVKLYINEADPSGGTTCQADYFQIAIAVFSYDNNSTWSTTPRQTMVCYVTKP